MASQLSDPPAHLLPFPVQALPLRVDDGGIIRVGKSRVSLDLVVDQYNNGVALVDLVRAYDTLSLSDVHAVIAYYLDHRDEVHRYLTKRAEEARLLRDEIESARPRFLSDELLTRRTAQEQGNVAPGE